MSEDARPIWAVVAGRMGSSRMPGKTMADLAGRPSLLHIVDRLRRVPALDGVVIATTDDPSDDPIRAAGRSEGVPVFSGSPDDVLDRTLRAARSVGATTIVQVTGDCPLVDPDVVGATIEAFLRERPDYASTVLGEETWPVGLDVEVFATETLAGVDRVATEPRHREHVSLYIYEHPEKYRLLGLRAEGDERRPELRLTLDTVDDYEVISAVYAALYPANPEFGIRDAIAYLDGRA
jgi:spore coat polysaccharide biosynthesis protein SpsF